MERNSSLADASIVPSELTGPLPRRVRSSPAGVRWAFLATGAVALTLAGTSWFSMKGLHQLQDRAALHRDGTDVIGSITGFSHAGKHNGILVVQYSFAVNGISFSGKADVPNQSEHDVQESSTLLIRYLPANPAVNHPAPWEESAVDAVVPLMLPMFPTMIGILMLLSDHKERRLLAEGLPAIATITKFYCPGDQWRSNRPGDQRARYEFRTRDGDIHTGSVPFDDGQEIGTSLCVIYLPQNPRRNLPYPLFDYRVDQ